MARFDSAISGHFKAFAAELAPSIDQQLDPSQYYLAPGRTFDKHLTLRQKQTRLHPGHRRADQRPKKQLDWPHRIDGRWLLVAAEARGTFSPSAGEGFSRQV
jgi:hypothetical protein